MSYAVKEIFHTLQGEGAQAGRAAVFCRFAGCNLWTGREQDRPGAVCRFCDTDFRDTDGENGGIYRSAAELADRIAAIWSASSGGGCRKSPSLGFATGESGHGDFLMLSFSTAYRGRKWRPLPGPRRVSPKAIPSGGEGITRPKDRLWRHPREEAPPFVVCTGGEPLLQLDAALISALHDHGGQVAVETNGTRPLPPGLDWVCVSPKADATLVVRSGDELKLVYPQAGAPPEQFERLAFEHFFLQPMDGPERLENRCRCLDYCRRHPRWRLSLQMHKLLGIP